MNYTTIGVAVITYNGLKYLPQQLESILSQTRAVNHIVISDDCSTDGTREYLDEWARTCPVRVTLLRNERQLGLIKNFEQAVSAVEADIIFTSDQDDVWFPDKVEVLAGVLDTHPDVLLVHSDAMLVDAENQDMGKTLLGELDLSDGERQAIAQGKAFEVYCRRNVVTGATVAFRAGLLQLARPFPLVWYHDAWLAWIAAATGRVHLVDRATIRYRQHGANLCGVRKHSALMQLRQIWWRVAGPASLSTRISHLESMQTALHTRLTSFSQAAPACLAVSNEALAFIRRRRNLPRNPITRSATVLGNVVSGRYGRFSNEPWSDVVRDVLKR